MRVPRLFILVLASVLGSAAMAAEFADIPRPADAQAIDPRPAMQAERTYPLGAVRKISNQIRMDGQVSARGQLSSVTYELAVGASAMDALNGARQSLQDKGGQVLFWCQGQECGESSLWANQIFANAKLVGADEQQGMILLRHADSGVDTLVALYGINRNGRKPYLHVEQLVAESPLGTVLPTPATLLRELRGTGRLDYPDLGVTPPPADWVALLARSLNQDSTLRVTLAGPAAEPWRQALVAQGVRAARLELGNPAKAGLHIDLIR
ncbi:DUF4892 domain-containing protein [Pseudomonas sp. M47T1]|uniref:DUF4892 domain-containing protein n=1 Tax=Pseudomonas sp. M47T1 TaxID=1179778 RepID=UPI003FD4A8A5